MSASNFHRGNTSKVLEFDVPINTDEEELLDFVADEISNITGFCHKSFKVSFA